MLEIDSLLLGAGPPVASWPLALGSVDGGERGLLLSQLGSVGWGVVKLIKGCCCNYPSRSRAVKSLSGLLIAPEALIIGVPTNQMSFQVGSSTYGRIVVWLSACVLESD